MAGEKSVEKKVITSKELYERAKELHLENNSFFWAFVLMHNAYIEQEREFKQAIDDKMEEYILREEEFVVILLQDIKQKLFKE